MNNLPPGCSSPDGGIDHAYEEAVDKALDIASEEGLTATELVIAMKIGVAAIQKVQPLIDEAEAENKLTIAGLEGENERLQKESKSCPLYTNCEKSCGELNKRIKGIMGPDYGMG